MTAVTLLPRTDCELERLWSAERHFLIGIEALSLREADPAVRAAFSELRAVAEEIGRRLEACRTADPDATELPPDDA